MSAGDAAAFVAAAFPGHYTGRTWGYFAELARRASARVWKRVRKDGRFVELVGDSRAFVDAGVIALRLELAKAFQIHSGDARMKRDELEQLEAKVHVATPDSAAPT